MEILKRPVGKFTLGDIAGILALWLIAIYLLTGCAPQRFETVVHNNCTVSKSENTSTITCPDGSTTTVIDGRDGVDGTDGINGADGASTVTVIYVPPGHGNSNGNSGGNKDKKD